MARKGVVVWHFGITDETGPTTLLGFSEILKGGITAPPPRPLLY
jgi:hypothetical protein